MPSMLLEKRFYVSHSNPERIKKPVGRFGCLSLNFVGVLAYLDIAEYGNPAFLVLLNPRLSFLNFGFFEAI